ncbi:hypothetical protein [Paenibacillus naphthalenovorans]
MSRRQEKSLRTNGCLPNNAAQPEDVYAKPCGLSLIGLIHIKAGESSFAK